MLRGVYPAISGASAFTITMKSPLTKTVLLYGILLAFLSVLLPYMKFHFFIRELTIEFYVGCIALVFTSLGIWMGSKLVRKKPTEHEPFVFNEAARQHLGITAREIEVLQLISSGHSNQEIAEHLFLSLHTVKTHVSRLLSKLEATRRTEAIKKARSLQLIP
jgi:DNA-binding CsgD family transcriptional regulator